MTILDLSFSPDQPKSAEIPKLLLFKPGFQLFHSTLLESDRAARGRSLFEKGKRKQEKKKGGVQISADLASFSLVYYLKIDPLCILN